MKKGNKLDFEASLQQLERIVHSLEQGKLSLTDSLQLFKEGVLLTERCQKAIDAAEQQVKVLVGEQLEDFQASVENPTLEDVSDDE